MNKAPKPYDLPDPKLDLVLERVIDVPPEACWKAWTTPELLMPWFTPLPWTTVECEIDLKPGGLFKTVMRSPEGKDFPNIGCYLELVENRKLAWTSALGPGFRPMAAGTHCLGENFHMSAILTFEPEGDGTRYVARALHGDEAGVKTHADMGFHEGWSTCLDQLVAFVKKKS